jgi:hypothetical protein
MLDPIKMLAFGKTKQDRYLQEAESTRLIKATKARRSRLCDCSGRLALSASLYQEPLMARQRESYMETSQEHGAPSKEHAHPPEEPSTTRKHSHFGREYLIGGEMPAVVRGIIQHLQLSWLLKHYASTVSKNDDN